MARIEEQVPHALGKPRNLLKVQVRPLWDRNNRVNVFVGVDAACAKIRHSCFVVADGDGNILEATPTIYTISPFRSVYAAKDACLRPRAHRSSLTPLQGVVGLTAIVLRNQEWASDPVKGELFEPDGLSVADGGGDGVCDSRGGVDEPALR